MSSPIQEFYKNKTIFITGGTGFVGKVTIEKLLRSTELKRIYVLIRQKKGQDVQDRIVAWKDDFVFSEILKTNPNGLNRIVPISGDCKLADLGISKADRELLIKEVQVVLHGAATVRFTEPLHLALDINTRATRLMLELAKEMLHLEAYVHISTAYSNCVIDRINESFYPENLNITVDKALSLRETLGDKLTDNVTSVLIGKYPNTYTFTKALAEQVVQKEAGDLPLCVFRPGVILSGYKEPFDGWIDNVYGPTQLVFGTAIGVLRITRLNINKKANILPVDYCVNMMLALAWRTAAQDQVRRKEAISKPAVTVYNYVPLESNILNWGDYIDKTTELSSKVLPFSQMMWFPFLQCTCSKWVFNILGFFYHILPAFYADIMLRIRGQKGRMVEKYRKLHNTTHILAFFGATTWRYETRNTENLWQSMTPKDQEIFNFDMKSLDWDDYFYRLMVGMRIFLGKEDASPEGIRRSQKIRTRYYVLHRTVQFFLVVIALAILWFGLKFLISFF